MEKYRRFGDAGTGIQPFVPEEGPARGVLGKLFLGGFSLVVKIAILLVVVPVTLVVYMLPGFGFAFRPLVRLSMFALGFFSIPDKTWPLTSMKADNNPLPGDVILTNFCGYIDILEHARRGATVFAFTNNDKIAVKGFLGALKHATLSYDEQSKAVYDKTVKEAVLTAKTKGVPLVLFFEGTPTNGKGVLSPAKGFLGNFDLRNTKFHLRALVYADETDRKRWSAAFPQVYPFSAHFTGLLSRSSHYLKYVSVSGVKTPQYSSMPDVTALQKTLISRLCEGGSMGAMSLTMADKKGFLDHWNETRQAGYTSTNPNEM
eukprot:TRINITY_DN1362_c5_g1_i1.p1 TRINITY_DN1362_c5_g1~~TRINITY_DN1362_c5_g1_i1.p1  ORF type:complete len:317 (+),score=47.18 TRINITY_DN1362_c5_g1_i1:50-1000(+)